MANRLTEHLVLSRSRQHNLDDVVRLNLFGNDLVDVSILEQCPNLEVVSLSNNRISSLRSFSHCIKLKELYIRQNDVTDICEIVFLKNLKSLRTLWLNENPCSSTDAKLYRLFVIRMLPSLRKLDDEIITISEREDAMSSQRKWVAQTEARALQMALHVETGYSSIIAKREKKYDFSSTNLIYSTTRAMRPAAMVAACPSAAVGAFGTGKSGKLGTVNHAEKMRRSNALQAVLHLLQELDQESLSQVQFHCKSLLADKQREVSSESGI